MIHNLHFLILTCLYKIHIFSLAWSKFNWVRLPLSFTPIPHFSYLSLFFVKSYMWKVSIVFFFCLVYIRQKCMFRSKRALSKRKQHGGGILLRPKLEEIKGGYLITRHLQFQSEYYIDHMLYNYRMISREMVTCFLLFLKDDLFCRGHIFYASYL